MPTPAAPGNGYLLDWEDPAINGAPTTPPPGWNAQFNSSTTPTAGGTGYDRFRVEQYAWRGPLFRRRWVSRFELRHGEPALAGPGSVRCVLSDGVQQFDEGWYGFSILLPSKEWDAPGTADAAGEILVQWHHNGPGGSPPLAILTRNGSWHIGQDLSVNSANPATPVGNYDTNRWTDWVVHAIWSPTNGSIQVWKDVDDTPVFSARGQTTYDPPEEGIYMKFGIYKWAWDPQASASIKAQASTNTRVVYHDELRIMGPKRGQGHRGAVAITALVGAPRPSFLAVRQATRWFVTSLQPSPFP